MAIDQYDSLELRCLKLGGEVPFKYCRTTGEPFCARIIVCWAERMDIGTFLAQNFSPEQIQSGLEKKSPGRLEQIFKTINKIKS